MSTGLETLEAEGMDLQALHAGCTAELLEWHSVADHMPDAELTVLVWFKDRAGVSDWCGAWWNGERWLDCATADDVWGKVTHWAQPEGPA